MEYEVGFWVSKEGFSILLEDENGGEVYSAEYKYSSSKGSCLVKEHGEIPDPKVEEHIDKILDHCNEITNHLQIVASLNDTL